MTYHDYEILQKKEFRFLVLSLLKFLTIEQVRHRPLVEDQAKLFERVDQLLNFLGAEERVPSLEDATWNPDDPEGVRK